MPPAASQWAENGAPCAEARPMSVPSGPPPVLTLQTEHLRLAPRDASHAGAFLAYNERNRTHFAPWEPVRGSTLADYEAELARGAAEMERGAAALFFAFEHAGADVVATVNLHHIVRGVLQSATLGYNVDAACVGRGYATEMSRAVIRYAFDELRLHRVEASYQPHNEPSGRVLRKLGFTVEGYSRDFLYIAGAWRDAIRVALVNPAWAPEASP